MESATSSEQNSPPQKRMRINTDQELTPEIQPTGDERRQQINKNGTYGVASTLG